MCLHWFSCSENDYQVTTTFNFLAVCIETATPEWFPWGRPYTGTTIRRDGRNLTSPPSVAHKPIVLAFLIFGLTCGGWLVGGWFLGAPRTKHRTVIWPSPRCQEVSPTAISLGELRECPELGIVDDNTWSTQLHGLRKTPFQLQDLCSLDSL